MITQMFLLLIMALSARSETLAQPQGAVPNSRFWIDQPEAAAKVLHRLELQAGARADVIINESESAGAAKSIRVDIFCPGTKVPSSSGEVEIKACKYLGARYDQKTGRLIVTFKTSKIVAGVHSCVKQETFEYFVERYCPR